MSDFYLSFRLLDEEYIENVAVCEITNSSTFDHGLPKSGGVNDARMGSNDRSILCQTCHRPSCAGHAGYIKLPTPIILTGHLKDVLFILRSICTSCCRPRFTFSSEDAERFPGLVNVSFLAAKLPDIGRERLKAISEALYRTQ